MTRLEPDLGKIWTNHTGAKASLRGQYGDIVPNERRKKMLKATMLLVARDDVPNVTMDKIAEQAGISRVTLYREFGNRASLFEAVIAYRLMQFDRRFFQRISLQLSLAELVEEYLVASVRIAQRNPVTARWAKGGMSFLRDQSQVHRVAVASWSPILQFYKSKLRMTQDKDPYDVALWINVLQYSFARLAIEAELKESEVRAKISLFVAPAFR
jgi:AcrR family transcriptional regulator